LLLGRIASQLADAAALVFVTWLLGRADYGAFATVMLVYSTAAVLLTAGFPQAVLYFLAGAKVEQRRAVVQRMLQLNVLLGLLLALLLVLVGALGPLLFEDAGADGIV